METANVEYDEAEMPRSRVSRVSGRAPRARDQPAIEVVEALALLDRAILNPVHVLQALYALDAALGERIVSILEHEPFCDVAFLSAGHQRQLRAIQQRYVVLQHKCQDLSTAWCVNLVELKRIRRELTQIQRDEIRLVFDAVWTDIGGRD